jgi:HK97 gp10 family phage protein
MRLKVDGVDDVIKALREADEEIQKALKELISEAAEIVFREADARVPIGETERTRHSLRIEIGQLKSGAYYANVVVGARQGETTETSAFYVTFYEYGSTHQDKRPFMRPALDKSRARVRKLLTEGLQKIIAKMGE